MNIALIGYGKMGKEIESILIERGHTITLRATRSAPFKATDLHGTDVAIEFTEPHSAVDHILRCFEARVPIVVGTTGWYTRMPEMRDACKQMNGGLFTASNFSIGVNVLFEVNRMLARVMSDIAEYSPSMEEIHHTAKRDAPSGTAITLAEGILENYPTRTGWINESTGDQHQLGIVSRREGEVPGTHIVRYTSAVDEIQLVHQAFNRKGFALGAVKAAEFMNGKSGVFGMKDLLG
ncbi:MAG: 4-hydroxy-tetrahydrodipicolinate reductase [Flavobacteriales bacterium]